MNCLHNSLASAGLRGRASYIRRFGVGAHVLFLAILNRLSGAA